MIIPVPMMAVGDSCTEGYQMPAPYQGGWRTLLDGQLQPSFPGKYKWVGPFTDANGLKHAAIAGSQVRTIRNNLLPWLASYQPEILLLMLGVADLAQGNSADWFYLPSRVSALLQIVRHEYPDLEIVVSKIPHLYGPTYGPRDSYGQSLNVQLGRFTEQVKGWLVCPDYDQPGVSSLDGVHPDLNSYSAIRTGFYGVVEAVLDQKLAGV